MSLKALRMGKEPSLQPSSSGRPSASTSGLLVSKSLVYALAADQPWTSWRAVSRIMGLLRGVSETRDWEALHLGMGLALLGFG